MLTLLTPLVAHSQPLLLSLRIVEGLGEAVTFPAAHSVRRRVGRRRFVGRRLLIVCFPARFPFSIGVVDYPSQLCTYSCGVALLVCWCVFSLTHLCPPVSGSRWAPPLERSKLTS